MGKKRVGALIVALFVQNEVFLYAMEGQRPDENVESGINSHPDVSMSDRYRESRYSLSASRSFNTQTFSDGLLMEAELICAEKYLTGEELADYMLALSSFNLERSTIFLEHGANLTYALKRILSNAQIKGADLRNWVFFCLIHGAVIPEELAHRIPYIIGGDRIADVTTNIINGLPTNATDEEVRELFLYATGGQTQLEFLESLLLRYPRIIQTRNLQEGFINAAYAGQIDILKMLYEFLLKGMDKNDETWLETFSYALARAAQQGHSDIVITILNYGSLHSHDFSLDIAIGGVEAALKLEGLPEEIRKNYEKLLDRLRTANTTSEKDKVLERLIILSSEQGGLGNVAISVKVPKVKSVGKRSGAQTQPSSPTTPTTPRRAMTPRTPRMRRAQTDVGQPNREGRIERPTNRHSRRKNASILRRIFGDKEEKNGKKGK